MRQPCSDAVRDRRERLRAPVVDLAPEQLAEEPLVRRRQQQRVAERGVHAPLSRSSTALCAGVLPRSRPASSTICSGASPTASARRGPLEQERGDVGDEVVVVRLGVGHAGPQPDVGGDDRRVVLRRDREVVGIAEAADVVADDRARRARGVEHRRAPRVDRERRRRSARAAPRSRARPGRAPRPRRPRARARPSRRRRRAGRRRRRRAPRRAARNASNAQVAPRS